MNPFYKQAIAFLILCNVFLIQAQTSTPTYNKVDSKGNKDGVWKGIYEESKRPRYEGTFNHGKETGVFKFFDDTKAGTVIATREFVPKDNSAYTIFYDQNKNKVSEGKVINKVFEGQWKYYHQASTVIMATEFYKNGKLQGLRSVYFPSGKIAEEINYKDNLKEGSYKKYSEKGIVLEESQFKKDQYNGPSIFRDVDGTIVSKGQFVNGKKEGVWQFFEKGKLVKTQNMSFPEISTKTKS
ncbi:toxin-antitoxin system YwqK family antitoxin [Flavobacterium restrictum]|uniref:Antitoxin component YwqK of the YwqJK toxin-antitoxin module n=1 Tax=Flavobacterium restrictum TaxID=2594428 RepID=A0A553E418_9FLAO|nr:hypothetical protein [Flavobacterium restrictum]TRX39769.1 hypothetical protein FNW21_08675 [Flavobacterium restrictum]